MNIKEKKEELIQKINTLDEASLERLELFLEEVFYDSDVEEILTKRALEAEKDIKEGNIFSVEEARNILKKNLKL